MSALGPELLDALSAVAAAACVGLGARAARGLRWRRVGTRIFAWNERWLPQRLSGWIEAQIRAAGLEADGSGIVASIEIGCVAGALAGGLLAAVVDCSLLWSVAFAVFGAARPLLRLRDRTRDRQQRIARALPYDLDLLTLSVEAGLDFTAAIAKVVEKGRPGPLADELSIALKELKLGKTREDALRNLARRCDLPALTSFVQALVHADRLGTPLGKTLRLLSTQMRIERTQRAEKLANEAPVKLLLPLIGCIFPTIFLTLFAPIFYQVFLAGEF